MTTITIQHGKHGLCGFRVEGHSGYGTEGGDIVCASISSAVMLTVNGVMEVEKIPAQFDVEEETAAIRLALGSTAAQNPVCAAFLQAFALHMQMLCEEFGEYMKMEYEEVQQYDEN